MAGCSRVCIYACRLSEGQYGWLFSSVYMHVDCHKVNMAGCSRVCIYACRLSEGQYSWLFSSVYMCM